MSESVPVRCPVCRRDHQFTPTSYPCPCGRPVAPTVAAHGTPENVTDRAWSADWVTVSCPSCGRADPWPRPELGCSCGAVLRVPLAAAPDNDAAAPDEASDGAAAGGTAPDAPRPTAREGGDPAGRPGAPAFPAHIPLPATASVPRPAFRPTVIRTPRDAVTVTALYLRWLGYGEIRRAEQPLASGVGLAADGLVAAVEPTVRVTSLKDVECLWLVSLTGAERCAYFALAGYEDGVREGADALGVPLFVVDLAGVPQPVNGVAEELVSTGA
ncbi:hypothetical protein [Streptomyces sp. NPDC005955]|uniref:hypothetical protein n=1 Tax=Streptomyces sp. NPDC005955 TaxID=3364738 RepID=UPI0036A525AB